MNPTPRHWLPMTTLSALAFSRWCREHGVENVNADGAGCQIPVTLPTSTFKRFEAQYPSEAAQRAYLRQYLHAKLGRVS